MQTAPSFRQTLFGALFATLAFLASPAPAQTPLTTPDATAQTRSGGPGLYVPPMRGAPERRVGGASRGDEGSDVRFSSLAPEHSGRSGVASPTLYWFSSRVVPEAVIFSLDSGEPGVPVIQHPLPHLTQTGLQRIDLDELGIVLDPGKAYEWTLTVRRGGDDPARDWVCGGAVYFDAGEVPTGTPAEVVRQLAGQGRWYEALASVEQALTLAAQSSDQPAELLGLRERLLREVGLDDLAQHLLP